MEGKTNPVNNLANYYVLPLLSLNKNSYGEGNFINSYVSTKGEIVVEVEDLNKVPQGFDTHNQYLTDFELEDRSFILYRVPAAHSGVLELFREGKYSQFKEATKEQIRRWSGLMYNKMVNGKPYTTDLLLVLTRDSSLRKRLEKELDIKIDPSAELRDKPSNTNFINF